MKMEKMLTLKQMRVIENYKELIKAGLDKVVARTIALKVSVAVILTVAVSDLGVHVELYEVDRREEKTVVFRFVA
jgi:hypothetical protein